MPVSVLKSSIQKNSEKHGLLKVIEKMVSQNPPSLSVVLA